MRTVAMMYLCTNLPQLMIPIKTIKVKSIDQRKPYIDSANKKLLIERKKLYEKYCLRL